MCDTMGVLLKQDNKAFFAKNSDRSPNEPQVLEWYAQKTHTQKMLKATYLEIEQAAQTYALLLSRPVWMWGGEMGVNECGVSIGNEAVFTKGRYAKKGLTGMDLLRLGLERGKTAKQALFTIIELLERYGQGGNCGYDKEFIYDNSFLIQDSNELYVLETAGKNWVYKQAQRASISNRLSVRSEGDAYSAGNAYDFRKRHSDLLYTYFSGSKTRREQSAHCVASACCTRDFLLALRTHAEGILRPLTQNSVKSVCMHAGGSIGDHTTASMIVEWGDPIKIWATGSSTPCISLFKPFALGNAPHAPVFLPNEGQAYWHAHEEFHRGTLFKILPADYYIERDALEEEWLSLAGNADAEQMRQLTEQADKQERAFCKKWENHLPGEIVGQKRIIRYWQKKNKAFHAQMNTVTGHSSR